MSHQRDGAEVAVELALLKRHIRLRAGVGVGATLTCGREFHRLVFDGQHGHVDVVGAAKAAIASGYGRYTVIGLVTIDGVRVAIAIVDSDGYERGILIHGDVQAVVVELEMKLADADLVRHCDLAADDGRSCGDAYDATERCIVEVGANVIDGCVRSCARRQVAVLAKQLYLWRCCFVW